MGSHCGDVPAVCGQILHDFMAHSLVVCTVLGQLLCCGAFSPHWLWQRCSRSGIPTVRVPSASLWRHSVTWHGSGDGAVLTGACLSLVTAVLLARFAFNVFVAPSFSPWFDRRLRRGSFSPLWVHMDARRLPFVRFLATLSYRCAGS